MHPIYRTDLPLLPTVRFLYIYSINTTFLLFLNIFVYSSTKYRVFRNVTLLGSLNIHIPIYRTDVPLLPIVRFLYIQSINIFNYVFGLFLTIFVYSSTKYRVFRNVTLLGSLNIHIPIYRTDVTLFLRLRFLYIQSINTYFFLLSLTIFVYSSTKCRVFPNVILLGS